MRSKTGNPIVTQIENALHPYVRFLILPLFAFANAGLSLAGLQLTSLAEPLPLAITLGLFLGKPLGIVLVTGLAVAMGIAKLPEGGSWTSLLGIGFLAGIGFTMSLFIGSLAFNSTAESAQMRLGVISGSLISVCLGFLVLWYGTMVRRRQSLIT
jgi:NhaA family Na+:H+ antiporter